MIETLATKDENLCTDCSLLKKTLCGHDGKKLKNIRIVKCMYYKLKGDENLK